MSEGLAELRYERDLLFDALEHLVSWIEISEGRACCHWRGKAWEAEEWRRLVESGQRRQARESEARA